MSGRAGQGRVISALCCPSVSAAFGIHSAGCSHNFLALIVLQATLHSTAGEILFTMLYQLSFTVKVESEASLLSCVLVVCSLTVTILPAAAQSAQLS